MSGTQIMYTLNVCEGGDNYEIIGIMCMGFKDYIINYRNGCFDENTTKQDFEITTEQCDQILALTRSAYQKALETHPV